MAEFSSPEIVNATQRDDSDASSDDDNLDRTLLGGRAPVGGPARASVPAPSAAPTPAASLPLPREQRGGSRFNADWVRSLYDEIQEEIESEGIGACMWEGLLDKWCEHIKDVPYERVQVACAKQILQHARLTSASASPMFYESLRKLGKDVLRMPVDVDENLLERLLPTESDSKWYRGFFGDRDKWTTESLVSHLKNMHGSSNMKVDKKQEQTLGFIVAHVRSNRYSPIEMQAIIKHLIKDVDEGLVTRWMQVSAAFGQGADRSEAQSFILRCVEALHRERQSLEGTVKRGAAAGVLLFADVWACTHPSQIPETDLDRWLQAPSSMERIETLEEIDQIIEAEYDIWKEWKQKHQKERPDIKVKENELFAMMRPENLSSPGLIPSVMSAIKTYGDKKALIKEAALKGSQLAVVQAIMNLDLSQQEQSKMRASTVENVRVRRIAVFGYCLDINNHGVVEKDSASVIIRTVPLTRKQDVSGAGAEVSEISDYRLYELGVNIKGTYIAIHPENFVDLNDMLKTSGLRLNKDDRVEFFQFVPPGTHCPSSKPVVDLLSSSEDGDSFSHVLLTETGDNSGNAQSEIADAGGRFLVDMKRVGSVVTEGMRYQPLAVEAAASVKTLEDGTFTKIPFRRLAVLMPPSMSEHETRLGKLSRDMEKGEGFSESAEILAEVLSLVLIDETNLDLKKYDEIIHTNLKQNPLLLYYTSMELLDTVNPKFARSVAEYWEDKLCVTGSNFNHLSKHEQEAREIILSLITLHRSSDCGTDRQIQNPAMGNGLMTPREPMRRSSAIPLQDLLLKSSSSRVNVNVGKRVALASEAHLSQLPGLISTQTHFAQEEIYVEETNFESTLQRLKRASPTSLTFVFVYITGRISADQMSQIVTVPVPAIKLIFRYSSSIVDLLELIPTISDLVYKPKTILEELSGKLRPVQYSSNSAVGSVVEFTMSKLKKDPSLISNCQEEGDGFGFWDGDGPEQAVAEASQWRLNVQKWLQEKSQGESAFVRILVTTDDKATVKALSSFLKTNMQRVEVRVVDAGDPQKFDDLKHFLESTPTTLHYSDRVPAPVSSATAHAEVDASVLPPREIFILSRASFLPHARLEVLVSRCAKKGTRLLLLVAEATSSMSRFRMFKDPRAPPVWIRVPILKQRLLGGVAGVDTVDFSQSSDRVMLAFVGLQLILSPEAIVTEEHNIKVRQFVESNDATILEFLDQHDSLDSSTRSEMLSRLADVVHDEKVDRSKRCRFAVVLAEHVNRYVRFRSDPQSPLVSFSDFCKQPTVRFLSQIHRLEAYTYYLFHRTRDDKRITSDATRNVPYGLPLARCLSELTDTHNIHHASQPGPLLMCLLVNPKDMALKEAPGTVALPMPQYVDPGKGDVVTQMQEIVEHRALASSELHWNEMYERWQSGPELTDDVLEHILVNSACRISVLLSMTPAQIFNLTLSPLAVSAVSHDFDACAAMLRSMPVAEFPVLRTRTAAIWWLLLLAGAGVKRVDDKVFCEEQGLLLEAGIYIEPRANHTEKERIELLSRVTRVMIQLDNENTLTSQHGVRSFLLSDERRGIISPILDDPQVKLGNAFINAVVARETLNAIMEGASGSVIFEGLGDVLQWVKESKGADANKMSRQMAKFASRITPDALVTLLRSANPPSDLEKARDGILMPCLRAQGHEDAQRNFLDAVLEPLCQGKPEMAVEVLEVLAKYSQHDQFPAPRLGNLPAFWPLLFQAFQTRDSALAETFFLRVHDHVNTHDRNFALPFESSPSLCSMYVDSCKLHETRADSKEVLDRHAVVLASELSRTAVFKQLMLPQHQPEIERNQCLLALLFYTWWVEPGASIPLPLLPKASAPSTWELFKTITRRLKPDARTVSKGMSILARFAIAPHTVPASILNTLQKTMVGGDDPVMTKTYVLAQMDSTTYPVYAFRTHTRTLPTECKEQLIAICKGQRSFESKDHADKMRLLFPLTDSGLSQKTVSHNLNILVNIKHAECIIDPDHTSFLRAQLFLTTWTWFEAAGFTMQDLKKMCASEEERQLLQENKIDMNAVYDSPNFAQKLVYQSLPVYVDVRFCSGKDVPLFQISQESVAVTMQWLHMLTMQYECCPDAPQQFYNYTVDRANGVAHDASLPSQIVTRIFHDIAGNLMKKNRDLELLPSGQQSHHIVLVLDDSGSMKNDWNSLVKAVKSYLDVRSGLGVQDRISIVIHNHESRVFCSSQPLSECVQGIDALFKEFRSGGNCFRLAFIKTLEVLQQGPQNLPPAVLFMSDGGCDDGEPELRQLVSTYPGVIVDTLAFGSGADKRKLQALADIAGGKMKYAENTTSLRHKFAEVASGLSKGRRHGGDESLKAREASMARSCAAVVDDVVPIVDFFGQLRASGSADFGKYCMEGLSTGLQASSEALQVCVADALYMLLGVTPANKGTEVLCMLEMWRDKKLSLGSSIHAEVMYMAANVWEPSGLGDSSTRLVQILVNTACPMKIVGYVRNPTTIPLAEASKSVQHKPIEETYAFTKGIQLVACSNVEARDKVNTQDQSAMSSAVSQDARARTNAPRHIAQFDHAASPDGAPDVGQQASLEATDDVLEEHADFFAAAPKDEGSFSRQNKARYMRQMSIGSAARPRTISARDLVQIERHGGGGYSVVRIVPGLHPVLRSPADSCNIPVLQQKSLGRRDSIEKSCHSTHSKIDRIFSNNGATWEHLNQLPAGSTLMGRGFYLRKSSDGGWVLLMGASTQETLDQPPYHLWSVLDTVRLAALDFDEQVIEVFKGIVCLAFDPKDLPADNPRFPEGELLKMLHKIRRDSVMASHGGENASWYFGYLKRELTICKHIQDVLSKIRDESSGRYGSTTVESTFKSGDLEKDLSLQVKSIQNWAEHICKLLGLLVGIRNWVPRSQLIFTLELVIRNSDSAIRKLERQVGDHEQEAEADDSIAEDAHSDASEGVPPFDIFDDEDTNAQVRGDRNAGAGQHMAPRQLEVSDVYLQNRLIAAHEHITQRKFNQESVSIVADMTKRKRFKNRFEWIKHFEDSDEEDESKAPADTRKSRETAEESDEDDQIVEDAHRVRPLGSAVHVKDEFDDDELDLPLTSECGTEHEAIFPSTWGYGAPVFSSFCATSIMCEHIPMYHVPINVRGLKIAYSDSEGLPVAFLFHKAILRRSLKRFVPDSGYSVFFNEAAERESQEDEQNEVSRKLSEDEVESKMKDAWNHLSAEEKQSYAQREEEASNTSRRANYRMLAYREELLRWMVDLVRSPLPTTAIHWFLDKLENGATTQSVPSLTSSVNANDNASENEIGGNLNLLVIAHCIAKALPTPNEAKSLFSNAFHIPPSFLPFTNRKNDIYGIHIVRGGTLKELQDHGAVVEVCDLGYDALTRSKDNASMYLSIIKLFSKFIWLVYVIGLDTIDDALLKWLAEYTRAHPWRFVYLENTQTSWNFSENRDRCVYDQAPLPVERGIKCEQDLERPAVKQLRPTHLQPYPRISDHCKTVGKKESDILEMDWDQLSKFTRSFFSHSSVKSASHQIAESAKSNWSEFFQPGKDEYRKKVREVMEHSEPCVLLLCSPPGAGKSHFANELAELIKSKLGLRRAFIDGSDDRLVDMALAEILNVELPDPTRAQFLVVDEFHMLKEHHKCELFEWLKVHARRLHVLFIANRKDARDEELLEDLRKQSSNIGLLADRIESFSTRLGRTLLSEVMDKRGTKDKENILRWMHCSRCLFGGEAVSLRGIAKLEESLQGLQAENSAANNSLVNLLLNKIPTVSEATAQEFVACFCASLRAQDPLEAIPLVAQAVKGPVSLMMQASLLTERVDTFGTDYPDFVHCLDRAYDASPALRIAAWCCQMREAARGNIKAAALSVMDAPKPIFLTAFVDQCSFPLQLEESSQTSLSQGLAFSWGGDYTRLREIIDAVKHGHSVDWKDVHDRCWKCEPVQDSGLLVELLSVCTSPAKVLSAITKENLCSLLKKSKPNDALSIARDVLKYRTHKASANEDKFVSPYRTALWMTILYDYKALSEPDDLLKLMGADAVPGQAAAELDSREVELADALAWASTHMMDMKIVCCEDDPKRRLKFLVDTLVFLSKRLIHTDEASHKSFKVAHLWGGMFAPLLSFRSSDKEILVHVAMNGEDCHSKWREPLPSLWRIAHGRGTAAQVDKIWVNCRQLLFEGQGDGVGSKLIPALAGGLLCVSGVIPYDLQETLLTSGSQVDMKQIEDNTDDCENAMNLLSSALETLVKNDEAKINIQPGTFKRLVDAEIEKIKQHNRAMT